MIPKTIHYCWFGRNQLPKSAIKCISSWRKFFPDYEIKEWNEDNFDVNSIPYTAEAYQVGKYAFVSDYARFWILYHYGGVYFDTDVEVIKPMDDIIEKDETIVPRTTRVLVESGLQPHNNLQLVADIWIYPKDYFNPLDSSTGRLFKTTSTRSIHWYMASWQDTSAFRKWLSRMSHRIFGLHLHRIKKYFK